MMKHFKSILRLWFATTSVVGFLGGWVLFAHSGKPVAANADQQAVAVEATPFAPLPTLAPLPAMGDPITNLQPLPVMPQAQMFAPRMRTGGS